jgi:hypothetical protein
MRDALNATGRDIYFSMCEVHAFKKIKSNIFSGEFYLHGNGPNLLEIVGELQMTSRMNGTA